MSTLLFTLFLFAVTCTCVTIVSDIPSLRYINGQFVQKRQIRYRCSQADSGVPQLFTVKGVNSTYNMTINCLAPEYVYPKTRVGHVPKDGRLVIRQFCRTANTYAFNESLLTNTTYLSASGTHGRKYQETMSSQSTRSNYTERYAKRAKELGIPEREQTMSAQWGISLPFLGRDDGPKKLQKAVFDKFVNASNARLDALNNYQAATEKWQQSTTNTILELRSETEQLNAINAAQAAATAAALTTLEAEKNFNKMMFTTISRQISLMGTALDSARLDQIRAIQAADSAYSSVVNDTTIAIKAIANLTLNYGQSMNNSVWSWNKALSRFDDRLREIAKEMREYTGTLSDSITRIQDQQGLTKLVHTALDFVSTSTDFTPFLKSTGTAPSANLGPYKNLLVDIVRMIYRTDLNVLVQEDYYYYCNTTNQVEQRSSWANYRDLLSQMGPVGCTPGNPLNTTTNSDGTCICWVSLTRQECVQASSDLGNQFLLNNSMNATTFCQNGVVGLTVTGPVIYDNSSSLMTYQTVSKCNEVTSGIYYLKSFRSNTQIPVAHNSLQCTTNLEDIFDSSSNSLNYVYVLWKMIENSYDIARMNFRYYEDILNGVLPDGLSFKEHYFLREQNQSIVCTEAAFMAYSNEMLPAYRLDYSTFTTQTSVTINGVTTTQDNIIPSLESSQVLPASYKIIGEPGGLTVYDFDQNSINFGPLLSSRANTPSYVISDENSPVNTTLVSGERFDAYSAAYVAKFGECTVDPDTGLCNCPYNPASGSWCTVLNKNLVIDNGLGAIIISPNTWQLTADVEIPDGVITRDLLFLCPSVNIELVSGITYQAAITNYAVSDTFVRIEEKGPCSKTQPLFAVPKGGIAVRYNIDPCLLGNKTKTITFLYYNGTTATPCPGLQDINVTIVRTDFVSIGRPDVQYVDVRSVTEQDKVSLSIASSLKRLATIITDRTLSSLIRNSVIGLDVSSTTMVQFSSAFLLLGDITSFINSTFIEQMDREQYNYTELINNHYGDMSNILAFNSAQNNTLYLIDKLVKQQNVSASEFIALKMNELNLEYSRRIKLEAEEQFTEALLEFAAGVKDSINSVIRKDPCDNVLVSVVCDFGKFLYNDVIKPYYQLLYKLERLAVNFMKEVFNSAADFFGALLRLIPMVIITIMIAYILFKGIQYLVKRNLDKNGKRFKQLFPIDAKKKELRKRVKELRKLYAAIESKIVRSTVS